MLDELVHMTTQMLHLCEKGEWEDLCNLEALRRQLVLEYFETTLPSGEQGAQRRAQVIQSILAMDEQILSRCKIEKRYRGSELSRIQKGKVMSKAYSQNST